MKIVVSDCDEGTFKRVQTFAGACFSDAVVLHEKSTVKAGPAGTSGKTKVAAKGVREVSSVYGPALEQAMELLKNLHGINVAPAAIRVAYSMAMDQGEYTNGGASALGVPVNALFGTIQKTMDDGKVRNTMIVGMRQGTKDNKYPFLLMDLKDGTIYKLSDENLKERMKTQLLSTTTATKVAGEEEEEA